MKIDTHDQSFVNTYKENLYCYTEDLLSNSFPVCLYYTLSLIQLLQILAYSLNSQLPYSAVGIQPTASILQYINPQNLLRSNHTTITILIPIFTSITMTQMLLLVYTCKHYASSHQSSSKSKLTQHLNLVNIIYNTILIIPIFESSIFSLYCSDIYNESCYSIGHIVLCILAVVNLIWMILNVIYFNLVYYSRNPYSNNCLSRSNSWGLLVKTSAKLIPAIFLLFDSTLQYGVMFIGLIGLLMVGNIVLLKLVRPSYRLCLRMDMVVARMQVTITTVLLLILCQYFLYDDKLDNILFMYSWVVGYAIGVIVERLLLIRKEKLVLSLNENSKQSFDRLQQLYYYLNEMIILASSREQPMRILHIVRYHNKQCMDVQCVCHGYMQQLPTTNYQLGYELLVGMMSGFIGSNPKLRKLSIMTAYTLYHAVFQLSRILIDKVQYQQEYPIITILYDFQQQQPNDPTVDNYRYFNQLLTQLEETMDSVSEILVSYWRQLAHGNSSIGKLWQDVITITQHKQSIIRLIDQLREIYPNNVKVLMMGCQVFKYLLYDDIYYQKLMNDCREAMQEETNYICSNSQLIFNANGDLTVMTTCLNSECEAEILSCTSNVQQVLSYDKHQLVNQPLNKIMPKIYHQFHNKAITTYFQQSDDLIKLRQLMVFPLNSSGHIIKCFLKTKVFPSLSYGVAIIAFYKKIDSIQEYLLIYNSNNGDIDCMTHNLFNLFQQQLQQNKVLNVQQILPYWNYKQQVAIQVSQCLTNKKQRQFINHKINLLRTDATNIKILQIVKQEQQHSHLLIDINYRNSVQSHNKTPNQQQQMSLFDKNIPKYQSRITTPICFIVITIVLIIKYILLISIASYYQTHYIQQSTKYYHLTTSSLNIQYLLTQTTYFIQNNIHLNQINNNINKMHNIFQLLSESIIQLNHNDLLSVKYKIGNDVMLRNVTLTDGTLQLLNYMLEISTNINNNKTISNQSIYYIRSNSIGVISNFYRVYGLFLQSKIISAFQQYQWLYQLTFIIKIIILLLMQINLAIQAFNLFQSMIQLLKYYTNLNCIQAKILAKQCQQFKQIRDKQGNKIQQKSKKRIRHRNEKSKHSLIAKQSLLVENKQDQQIYLLQQKVSFQSLPSFGYTLKIIVASMAAFILYNSISYVVINQVITSSSNYVSNIIDIPQLRNSLMGIQYYSHNIIINNQTNIQPILYQINNSLNLIGNHNQQIFNQSTQIIYQLEDLTHVISTKAYFNINFYNGFQEQMTRIQSTLVNSLDNGSLKSLTNGLMVGDIILLVIYLKMLLVKVYRDAVGKLKRSQQMISMVKKSMLREMIKNN